MATELDLSIIIVNWNSAPFVRKCLSSIYPNTLTIRFEIIVIDNASRDGCSAMIERDFPAVRFIQNAENSGFARANNLGFQHSSGHKILFLNPDTEVVGPAIERLVQFLDSTSEAGVIGARLLNSDQSIQTSCIQKYPTIFNQVLDTDFLREHFRNWPLWGTRPLFDSPEKPAPVEVVSGACQMIRREVFQQVGFYDAGYFMYAEDVDLCFKARQAGWTNYFVGDAVVIHHGGRSSEATGRDAFATVMMRESTARFFQEHHGIVTARLYRAVMGVVSIFRLGLLAVLIVITFGCFRRERLSAARARWSQVLRWAIGMETCAKVVTTRAA